MYSKDLRVATVRVYLKIRSIRKVADLIGVPKSTVHRWVSQSPIVRRRDSVKKVTAEAASIIEDVLNKSGFSTRSQIADEIKRRIGLSISNSCVRFWMKRMGFTRKKPTIVVRKDGLDEARMKFAMSDMNLFDPSRVVSIDESSFLFRHEARLRILS